MSQIADSSAHLLAKDLEIAAAEGMAQETEFARVCAEAVAVRKQVRRAPNKKGKSAEGEGVAASLRREQEAALMDESDALENESEMAQFAMLEGWCFERDWRVTELDASATTHKDEASAFANFQAASKAGLDGRAQLRGTDRLHAAAPGEAPQEALRSHLAEEFATESTSVPSHVALTQARALSAPRSGAEVGGDESREEAERQQAARQAESRERRGVQHQGLLGAEAPAGAPQDPKLSALQLRLDIEAKVQSHEAEKELAVARQTIEKNLG